MAKDSQGSSHHLKVVGGAYGKRKDLIYETTWEYPKVCVNLQTDVR